MAKKRKRVFRATNFAPQAAPPPIIRPQTPRGPVIGMEMRQGMGLVGEGRLEQRLVMARAGQKEPTSPKKLTVKGLPGTE